MKNTIKNVKVLSHKSVIVADVSEIKAIELTLINGDKFFITPNMNGGMDIAKAFEFGSNNIKMELLNDDSLNIN